MRGKKEYPKMIYKNGEIVAGQGKTVDNCFDHKRLLDQWGDKYPDQLDKALKYAKKDIQAEVEHLYQERMGLNDAKHSEEPEPKEETPEVEVKKEVKPRRGRPRKSTADKKG